MENAPRSMITLSNVAYDVLEKGSVPPLVLREIVKRVMALWNKHVAVETTSGDAAAELLSITLDSADEDLFCRGPAVKVDESTSRVIDRGSLEEFYVRNTFLARAIRPHVPTRPRALIELTRDRIKPAVKVRGRRPVAWITKTSTVTEIENDLLAKKLGDNFATRLRDYFGLDHLSAKRELFEMRYPLGVLSSTRVAAPTFIEGACREVYRSNVDDDGWGRAVNIEDGNHYAGGPEAVHTPVTFTAAFRLRPLGVVRTTRVCSSTTLQLACPRQWKSEDADALEKYIK